MSRVEAEQPKQPVLHFEKVVVPANPMWALLSSAGCAGEVGGIRKIDRENESREVVDLEIMYVGSEIPEMSIDKLDAWLAQHKPGWVVGKMEHFLALCIGSHFENPDLPENMARYLTYVSPKEPPGYIYTPGTNVQGEVPVFTNYGAGHRHVSLLPSGGYLRKRDGVLVVRTS